MKKVSTYDETQLSRLLLEISLLDSAYQHGDVSQDLLMDAADGYSTVFETLRISGTNNAHGRRSR